MAQTSKSTRVTKNMLLVTLDGILDNFNEDVISNDKKKLVRSFILLNSFLTTMTVEESQETTKHNKLGKLYYDIFLLTRDNASDGDAYPAYTKKMQKLSKYVMNESAENEGDPLFEWDELSKDATWALKGIVKDMIINGAGFLALLTTGNFGVALGAMTGYAVVATTFKELDKRGKFINKDKLNTFFNKFRKTIDTEIDILAKGIADVNYTEEQIQTIIKDAQSISTWFKSKKVYGIIDNMQREDKEVNMFMIEYLNTLKDESTVIATAKDAAGNYDIDALVDLIKKTREDFIENMKNYKAAGTNPSSKKDQDARTACLKAFSVVVYIISTLNKDDAYPELDKLGRELFDIMFDERNEKGGKIFHSKSKFEYDDLKEFFKVNNKSLDDAVAAAQSQNEAVMNEKVNLKDICKNFRKKIKKTGKEVNELLDRSLWDIAFAFRCAASKGLATGALYLLESFIFTIGSMISDRVLPIFFDKIKPETVTDRVVKKLDEIIAFLEKTNMKITLTLDSEPEMKVTESNRYRIMSFEQFMNESKSF